MNRLLLFCFLVIGFGSLIAQETYKPKSTISLQLEGPVGILQVEDKRLAPMLGLSLSFERKSIYPHLRFRAMVASIVGAYYNSDQSPPGAFYLGGEVVYLTNSVGSTFDFSAGLGGTISQSDDVKYYPEDKWDSVFLKFSAGYRFYFGDVFFFRIGLGYPTFTNYSIGWTF